MPRRITSLLAACALVLPAAVSSANQHLEKRSEVYQTNCSVCHGDDGKSQTEQGKAKKARDLSNKKWQESVDDARLVKSIQKGRDAMPAFGKKLTEAQVNDLVKEVRTLAK